MAHILGLGLDIVEIPRIRFAIQRYGERFLRKVYTPVEAQYCRSKRDCWGSFAARWAAKEAVFKAFSSGWQGLWWLNQIEVGREPGGKPVVRLLGPAAAAQAGRGVERIELSLTHGRELALAQVLLWGQAA